MNRSDRQPADMRFALYGVKSSGKTCILSALTMPRSSNPRQYACAWIEEGAGDDEAPRSNLENEDTTDPYERGWIWLSEQRDRLAAGALPRPNPNTDPLHCLFDFSAPGLGTVRVELIDYSGELVTATAGELKEKLREHMKECDGVLVLAEAPHANGSTRALSWDLEKLKSAFSQLLSERDGAPQQHWPVAFVLNKWDRRGPIDFSNPEAEQSKARAFLEEQTPEPPHRGLHQVIENAVTPRNVKLFPVSAFGDHQILEDGSEVPKTNDHGVWASFGLEDPFVWAITRKQQIDAELYEEAADSVSWWKAWQLALGRPPLESKERKGASNRFVSWIRGVSPLKAVSAGRALMARLPKGSALLSRVERAWKQVLPRFLAQCAFGVFFVVFVVALLELGWDAYRYRAILAKRDAPNATARELRADEEWLEGYFSATWPRHFLARWLVLASDEAFEELRQARESRDEQHWEMIREADEQARPDLVKRHQEEIGQNCAHKEAIEKFLAEYELNRKREGNRDHLVAIAKEIATFQQRVPSESEIRELITKLTQFPYPEAIDNNIREEQQRFEEKLYGQLEQTLQAHADAGWAVFRTELERMLSGNRIADAATHLAQGKSQFPDRIESIEGEFRERVLEVLESACRDFMGRNLWSRARDLINEARNSQTLVEYFQSAQHQKIDDLLTEIDRSEDQYLYSQVRKYRKRDSVSSYLNNAPLGTMRRYVEEYKDYLDALNGPLNLRLVLNEIQWGDAWDGWKHEIQVIVDGRTMIQRDDLKARARGRTSRIGGPIPLHGKRLNDQIRVRVRLIRVRTGVRLPYARDQRRNAGVGDYVGCVDNLDDYTLNLKAEDHANTASFALQGIPREPELPEWNAEN